jgi:hypothetical protein
LPKESLINEGKDFLGLQLHLLPLLLQIRWSGVGGDDDDRPTSLASLRLLFFDVPVFVLFADDAFTFPVTSVFTPIRSGAVGGENYGGSAKWI